MAAPSGKWACAACTFENLATALRCEMCDSERGPEHRQMTVAEVAEPVYADDELVTDDVPQATPVQEEPEYRRLIDEVTAQLDRNDGVTWEPSSHAVEAAYENFDDTVCQTFIEQKLYKIVEIFINIRVSNKGVHTWGDLRAIWRPNNKEVLYVRAFERCILNCTNICIKLMERNCAHPQNLKLVALVLDSSSKLYNDPPPRYTYSTSAIHSVNSGHTQLYEDVCAKFKEGGCFEMLYNRIRAGITGTPLPEAAGNADGHGGDADAKVESEEKAKAEGRTTGAVSSGSPDTKSDASKVLPPTQALTKESWAVTKRFMMPFVHAKSCLAEDVKASLPRMVLDELERMDEPTFEIAALNNVLGELLTTLAKLGGGNDVASAGAAAVTNLDSSSEEGDYIAHGGDADELKTGADADAKHDCDSDGKKDDTAALVLALWQRIALRCYRSEKLTMRRFGTEQLGILAASRLTTKGTITRWLRDERVLEDMLGPRMHPNVIPCVDKLLANISMSTEIIDLFMQQIGVTSVQSVMGTLAARSNFAAEFVEHILGTAQLYIETGAEEAAQCSKGSSTMRSHTSADAVEEAESNDGSTVTDHAALARAAYAFTKKFLGSESTQVYTILHKGPTDGTVALHCLTLLWSAMQSPLCDSADTQGFLDAFVVVAQHARGNPHRETMVERAIETIRSSLVVASQAGTTTDRDGRAGVRSVSDRRRAVAVSLRIIERIASTHKTKAPALNTGTTYYNTGYNTYYGGGKSGSQTKPYVTRGRFIEHIEEQHGLVALLLEELGFYLKHDGGSDDRDGEMLVEGMRIRLELLQFLHVHSTLCIGTEHISQLWSLCTVKGGSPAARSHRIEEAFFHWLRYAQDSVSHEPCFSEEVLQTVLEQLFCKRKELRELGPRGYHCLQAIFVSVNNNLRLFKAEDTEAVAKDMVFQKSEPPENRRGKRMIGARIRVLWNDGKMHEGKIAGYDNWHNDYKIIYTSGEEVKQNFGGLTKWHLLGSAEEARAGRITVTSVSDEDLVGLNAFWAVFLHAADDEVSTAAGDVLFAVYLRMAHVLTRATKEAAHKAREDALARLPQYVEGDRLDVQDVFESSKQKGMWLAKWRPASVVSVGQGSDGQVIRIHFDNWPDKYDEDINLMTQHLNGFSSDGSPGPILARAGTQSDGAKDQQLDPREAIAAQTRRKAAHSKNPFSDLNEKFDCRASFVDRLFLEMKRELDCNIESALLVHRCATLLNKFFSYYADKTPSRSLLGCGRGQWLKLVMKKKRSTSVSTEDLWVHSKITLGELHSLVLAKNPTFSTKTLILRAHGQDGDVLDRASNQTLEEAGVGGDAVGTGTVDIWLIQEKQVIPRCQSCYHPHLRGQCCNAVTSISYQGAGQKNTERRCTCTVGADPPPKSTKPEDLLPEGVRDWSPALDLAGSKPRFEMLLALLEQPAQILENTTRTALWNTLVSTPTNAAEQERICAQDMAWAPFFDDSSFWRVIYALHIVDANLLPADEAQRAQAEDWRRHFIESTGFVSLFRFFVSLNSDERFAWWRQDPLAAAVGLPVILRILNFCVAGSLGGDIGSYGENADRSADLGGSVDRPRLIRAFSDHSVGTITANVDFSHLATHLVQTIRHLHVLLSDSSTMALVPRGMAVVQAAIDGITSLQTIFRKFHDLANAFLVLADQRKEGQISDISGSDHRHIGGAENGDAVAPVIQATALSAEEVPRKGSVREIAARFGGAVTPPAPPNRKAVPESAPQTSASNSKPASGASKMAFFMHNLLLRSSSPRIREKVSAALLEISRLNTQSTEQIFVLANEALDTLQVSGTRGEDDDNRSLKSGHCSEYFELFTTLVPSAVHAGLASGLSDRIVEMVTGANAPHASIVGEDVMLVGLLNILTALISAEGRGSGASKASGFERKKFLRVLFHDFLMALPRAGEQREPRCQTPASRDAAFKLLHVLVHGEPELQQELVSMLSDFVHRSPPPMQRQEKGWGFQPDWEFDASAVSDTTSLCKTRNPTQQVGLQNRGMTCYLNSIVQQLFRLQPLRDAILSLSPPLPAQQEQSSEEHVNVQGKVGSVESTQPDAISSEKHVDPTLGVLGAPLDDADDAAADSDDSTKPMNSGYQAMDTSPDTTRTNLSVQFEDNFDSYDDDLAAALKASMADADTSTAAKTDDADVGSGKAKSNSEAEEKENEDKGEVIRQLQRAFMYMLHGRQGCYDPYPLVKACACLRLNFSVTSQNDCTELYDQLLDCIEEQLKGTQQLKSLKYLFGGKEVRQKTCHRCKKSFQISSSHFNRLELQCKENETMKGSIEECLELFTQPEVMKGDNQVFCDNCNDKCDMTFATCIDSLPNVLPLHLKRFDLDLRTFRTVKLNQRISFPLELDMHPYTEQGIKQRERRRKRKERQEARQRKREGIAGNGEGEVSGEGGGEGEAGGTPSVGAGTSAGANVHGVDLDDAGGADGAVTAGKDSGPNEHEQQGADEEEEESDDEEGGEGDFEHCWYDLVGTVVHRGQAGGGHYYSFARETVQGRWYKLNDDCTTEFNVESKTSGIEAECFGGEEERSFTSQYGHTTVETCERDNNALMLFFVRRDSEPELSGSDGAISVLESAESKMPAFHNMGDGVVAPVPPLTRSLTDNTGDLHAQRQSQKLRELLEQEVWKRNDELRRQQLLFEPALFHCLLNLMEETAGLSDDLVTGSAASAEGHLEADVDSDTISFREKRTQACEALAQLGTTMFVDVILRSNGRDASLKQWAAALSKLYANLPRVSDWLVAELTGERRDSWLQTMLLECDNTQSRQAFGQLVERTVAAIASRQHSESSISKLIAALLELTPVVAAHWLRAGAYLRIWSSLCSQPTLQTQLHQHAVVGWLVHLYLGPKSPINSGSAGTGSSSRRHGSVRAAGFPSLPKVGSGSGDEPQFEMLLEALYVLVDSAGQQRTEWLESLPSLSRDLWGCEAFIVELVRRNPILGAHKGADNSDDPYITPSHPLEVIMDAFDDCTGTAGTGGDNGSVSESTDEDSCRSLLTRMCFGDLELSRKIVTCILVELEKPLAPTVQRTPTTRRLHTQRKKVLLSILQLGDGYAEERAGIVVEQLMEALEGAARPAEPAEPQTESVVQLAELLTMLYDHDTLTRFVAAAVDRWAWLVEWLDNASSPLRQGVDASKVARDQVATLDQMRMNLRGGTKLRPHSAEHLACRVSGAGVEAANGVYYARGMYNGHPKYHRTAMVRRRFAYDGEGAEQRDLFICRKSLNNGRDLWAIFIANNDGHGIGSYWLYDSTEISRTSCTLVPPRERKHWTVKNEGEYPAPLVEVVEAGVDGVPSDPYVDGNDVESQGQVEDEGQELTSIVHQDRDHNRYAYDDEVAGLNTEITAEDDETMEDRARPSSLQDISYN
eukprot:g2993.t1